MEGIFGLLILAADIWAIYNIWQSGEETLKKVLWSIGVFIFPILGLAVWYFMGPKADD